MSATNASIGAVFDEIADWLELDQAHPFRLRDSRQAARTVGSWPRPLADFTDGENAYAELPGIGEDLAGKVAEIVASCGTYSSTSSANPVIAAVRLSAIR